MMQEYPCPGGSKAKGYLAKAAVDSAPGIVVIQEWWGLQQQIKGICDQFAKAGFHALAPDLYGGKAVPYHDPQAAAEAMSSLDFRQATEEGVRGACQFFASQGKKVALTGFCMGGAVTTIGALAIPEIAAAIPFYGIAPEAMSHAQDIRVPLQGHFANDDDWISPKMVNEFEAALKKAGKTFEIYRYEAKHGFMNEERLDVFNAKAKAEAWERTLAFLRCHLG